MSDMPRGVRGMHPVAPGEAARWQGLERACRELLGAYGYREIRLSLLERADLFAKSVGDTSDIVSREMYVFADRSGDQLALRPEGTAGCVRAALELSLLQQRQRLWYMGPMFRYERPQQGRSRQFNQVGVEAFGFPGTGIEYELILMGQRLWRQLGLGGIELRLNCIGGSEERNCYSEALRRHFEPHAASFNEEQLRTLRQNPIRLLDHKNERVREIAATAPAIAEYLDEGSRQSYLELQRMLQGAGVSYVHDDSLVRGLDYYNGAVFEWICADGLGAQNTVCAGGRYDKLVQSMGGPDVAAIGFAVGLDRVMALMDAAAGSQAMPDGDAPHLYMVAVEPGQIQHCLDLAERLRDSLPGLAVAVDCSGSGVKNQLRQADRSGARCAILLGQGELDRGEVTVKFLRDGSMPQQAMTTAELPDKLGAVLFPPNA